jgi:hypothetical protein
VGERQFTHFQIAPFVYPSEVCIASGRALRVADGIALPPVLAEAGEAADEALASGWTEDARAELASVPSFLRLAAELSAVGAPTELRDAAIAAANDERQHARAAFALASRWARSAFAVAPLERHAELSWRILDWCAAAGGTVVKEAVAEIAHAPLTERTHESEDADWLSWNGRLTAAERNSVRAQIDEESTARLNRMLSVA